jgi:hypothetical protein
LVTYIRGLFNPDYFPDGPPEPSAVTHTWGPEQAGHATFIVRRLSEITRRLVFLSPDQLNQLEDALSTIEVMVDRWKAGGPWRPGQEPRLQVRHVAAIYDLLMRELRIAATTAAIADTSPPANQAEELAPSGDESPQRRFGRWTVVGPPLGEGGQGEVFPVNAAGEPERALKLFDFEKDERAQNARERFKREVEALRSLDAPGFLRLHDADEGEGWMVTTLYPSTLTKQRDRFRGRALEALVALRPVVAALAGLHARGGVHRDVKPDNIFVDERGELVLGDFGIVFLRDADRLTATYERVGTRYWIAPWADVEQRRGGNATGGPLRTWQGAVVDDLGQARAAPLVPRPRRLRPDEALPGRRRHGLDQ